MKKFYFDIILFLALIAVTFMAVSALAQTNDTATNSTAVTNPATFVSATDAGNFFTAAIAVIVPIVIAFIKKFWAQIPSWVLPIGATALGVLATWLANEASLTTINPLWGLLLGAAGVGVREIKDQLFPAEPNNTATTTAATTSPATTTATTTGTPSS